MHELAADLGGSIEVEEPRRERPREAQDDLGMLRRHLPKPRGRARRAGGCHGWRAGRRARGSRSGRGLRRRYRRRRPPPPCGARPSRRRRRCARRRGGPAGTVRPRRPPRRFVPRRARERSPSRRRSCGARRDRAREGPAGGRATAARGRRAPKKTRAVGDRAARHLARRVRLEWRTSNARARARDARLLVCLGRLLSLRRFSPRDAAPSMRWWYCSRTAVTGGVEGGEHGPRR